MTTAHALRERAEVAQTPHEMPRLAWLSRGAQRAALEVLMGASQHLTEDVPAASIPRKNAGRRVSATLALVVVASALVLVAFFARSRPAARSEPDMGAMPGMEARPTGASSQAVFVSPARQQLIGVRTSVVQRRRAEESAPSVGVLAYDETRTTHIHVKVAGWVEHLDVDFVGKPVRRGQPLFSVYSPDLVAAESDYLVALRARRDLGSSASPSASAASEALVNAARERLRRWDVTDAEIAQLESSGKASRTVTLYSPFDGVVLERMTFAGQYVTPEMNTFKVADLSTIWVMGEAFESDAARVRVGAPIEVAFPNDPALKPLHATIDFVFPDIDPQTRRLRFRATVPNPGQKLKPDTYVTVSLMNGEEVDRLVVPREAVIDTGARKYVLIALADGYFDPRDVQVGPAAGSVYPVIAGLNEGDRVVTSAQFLIDSETNLMSAMQNMAMTMPGMDMGSTGASSQMPTMPDMPAMSGMDMPKPSATRGAPPHSHHPGM